MSKQLDPVIENELGLVDSALAHGRADAPDPRERELQELALLLEAESLASEPDPGFEAELGERVRAGFPRERRAPRLPRLRMPGVPRMSGPRLAAAGIAASMLLAIGVVVSLDGDSGQRDSTPLSYDSDDSGGGTLGAPAEDTNDSGDMEPAPLSTARDAGGGLDAMTIPPPPNPGGGNFVPGRDERRIERSASLTLAASGEELDRLADRVAVVTDRHGGFVLSSQVTSGEEGAPGGSFDLRIPVGRLQPALRDLAALGDVRSRSMAGRDVTREVVTAADRLQGARAERRSLLTRLENAATDTETEALRRRLDLNAAELRGLRSELRDLRLRTGYATVSLALVAEGEEDGGGTGGGSSSLDDALDDALDSLVASLGIALRILGVALPLGLLALATWLTARTLRRRRREAALS